MEYNGQVGYVFGDYLTTTAPQSQPAATTDASVTVQDVNETVYATVRLRMRASASLDGAVLGVATPRHPADAHRRAEQRLVQSDLQQHCRVL